ncbi:MAG: hypothetical protein H0W41_05465 [Chloroflexi bacterium]|nr:hypothetical protein [Chloroflexota bacterium]
MSMKHRPGDVALAAVNRHQASRIRRRKLRQFFRAVTPRINVKGLLVETIKPREPRNQPSPTTDRRYWK